MLAAKSFSFIGLHLLNFGRERCVTEVDFLLIIKFLRDVLSSLTLVTSGGIALVGQFCRVICIPSLYCFTRGALGLSVLRFWILFWSVFRFLCQKTSVFRFWCSMRLADFSFFSIWFSVFVKSTSGFSVLVPNVVFGFSFLFFLFGPVWVYSFVCGFRFWPILFAVLRFWMNFSPVLRFLVYPNAPLLHTRTVLTNGAQKLSQSEYGGWTRGICPDMLDHSLYSRYVHSYILSS